MLLTVLWWIISIYAVGYGVGAVAFIAFRLVGSRLPPLPGTPGYRPELKLERARVRNR